MKSIALTLAALVASSTVLFAAGTDSKSATQATEEVIIADTSETQNPDEVSKKEGQK